MTLRAFYNEKVVPVAGETLRFVLNFTALDAIESLTGCGFDVTLKELSRKPGIALQGKVVWGLLREHHPEVSLDQAASLVIGNGSVAVGLAISDLINAAFSEAEASKAKDENPTKPRGASQTSSRRGARKT